jgi:hypothetical protein
LTGRRFCFGINFFKTRAGEDMINYIYLLYGTGDDCYIEAAYGIGTLRKRQDAALSRIIVFTDQPQKVKDWPVECETGFGCPQVPPLGCGWCRHPARPRTPRPLRPRH